ncbi:MULTISPECIES: hypothetical protein [Flavobacterium]|uniref:Uncharacterized protein n=1 Tax=Flavobacterium keumense TaxID=1306518 RepID=A0ABY8N3F8_9FLAO|nr:MULTISPECIES: hypothetical protein [Flavobacterium]WGK93794.1 hypothetical protein MG292_06735 [Flavobacterium keumense]
MAFDLKTNNLSGLAIITEPDSALRATPENFVNLYDYAQQFQPELIPEMMFANGKGSILGFIRATTMGKEGTFESDSIQHSEINRLHNTLTATATGNVFTCTKAHQLRVKDVVKISDGSREYQAIVSAITSPLVFTALSDGAAFTFSASSVTVLCDFSNRHAKGDSAFDKGKKWSPKIYKNYPHIVKEYYEVSDSDLAHKTWIETPEGPKWFNLEMERNSTLFDNKAELTAVLHNRALDNAPSTLAGFTQGMKGVVQQVEERGNISNDYITTTVGLSNLALRAKRQGTCREFTVYSNHMQMRYFRELAAGVNASFLNGSNYGAFNNSTEMALSLNFVSIFIDGVTFHFTSWALLDDPTLLDANGFDATSLAYLMVPTGTMNVTEEGNVVARPYLTMRYRSNNITNRRRQVKFFGVLGQQVREDKSSVEILSEMTNQVVGANSYFVGRKGLFYA